MSYKDRAKAGAASAGTDAAAHCCRYCGKPTPYETMANLGARCGACSEAFCRNLPPRPFVPVDAVPHGTPKGLVWAYRLRGRHQAGERLTRAQIAAYTSALNWRERRAGDAGAVEAA